MHWLRESMVVEKMIEKECLKKTIEKSYLKNQKYVLSGFRELKWMGSWEFKNTKKKKIFTFSDTLYLSPSLELSSF